MPSTAGLAGADGASVLEHRPRSDVVVLRCELVAPRLAQLRTRCRTPRIADRTDDLERAESGLIRRQVRLVEAKPVEDLRYATLLSRRCHASTGRATISPAARRCERPRHLARLPSMRRRFPARAHRRRPWRPELPGTPPPAAARPCRPLRRAHLEPSQPVAQRQRASHVIAVVRRDRVEDLGRWPVPIAETGATPRTRRCWSRRHVGECRARSRRVARSA